MSRISRIEMFMQIAHIVAKRSTCFRLNVGAIVVIDNRIVSIGYNGVPSGEPHCTGHNCPGKDYCQRTIHAEVNAVLHLKFKEWFDMYCTHSPCEACMGMLEQVPCKRLFFTTPYRVPLLDTRILVYQVTPAGYIVDWDSKEMVDGLLE